ncbi:hypothetical protein I4U23_004022 [Adineta vaga]|nr:hypothetical protein I4U23_004022 [Adineta vaga]
MNSLTYPTLQSAQNYNIVAPISVFFSIIAVIISILILVLISLTKQLHTVTRLLTCNICLASILYCIVQCNNYTYLLFVRWEKSDQSCRWRGYFGYLAMIACVYSYILQVLSRFFFIVLSTKYRWLTSLKIHSYSIVIGWIIILVLPLPAILTNDIYFREGFLCWIPKKAILHTIYITIAYFSIPMILIFGIYTFINVRIHSSGNHAAMISRRRRKIRDLEIFRNITISFSIYFLGRVPYILFLVTNFEFFYTMGVISVTFAVTAEILMFSFHLYSFIVR